MRGAPRHYLSPLSHSATRVSAEVRANGWTRPGLGCPGDQSLSVSFQQFSDEARLRHLSAQTSCDL